jgi:hypothetical protein
MRQAAPPSRAKLGTEFVPQPRDLRASELSAPEGVDAKWVPRRGFTAAGTSMPAAAR